MPAKTNFTSKITMGATAAVVAVAAVVLTSIAFPLARADQPAPRRSPVASWWHNQTRKYMNRRRAAAKPATAARQAAPAKVPTVVTQPKPVPKVAQAPIPTARKTDPVPTPVVRRAPTPVSTPVVRRAPTPVPTPVVRKAPTPVPAPVVRQAPAPTLPRKVVRRAPQRLVRHATATAAPSPRIRQVVAQAPRMPANQQPAAVPTNAGFAHLSAPLYPSPVQNIPHQVGGVVITNPALAPHEMLYEHEYRALYPPFYYRVKGWWAWTPFGVESHDKWELMGTEVRVRYKSRPSLLQRLADPFIEPFID